jgi:uncharacterized protein
VIYLDSCVLIYLIEGAAQRKDEMARIMASAGTDFCISPMVKCECLVGPAKDADMMLRRRYLTLFDQFVSLPLPEGGLSPSGGAAWPLQPSNAGCRASRLRPTP